MRLRIRERGYSHGVSAVDFGTIVGTVEGHALAEGPSGEDDVVRPRPQSADSGVLAYMAKLEADNAYVRAVAR